MPFRYYTCAVAMPSLSPPSPSMFALQILSCRGRWQLRRAASVHMRSRVASHEDTAPRPYPSHPCRLNVLVNAKVVTTPREIGSNTRGRVSYLERLLVRQARYAHSTVPSQKSLSASSLRRRHRKCGKR